MSSLYPHAVSLPSPAAPSGAGKAAPPILPFSVGETVEVLIMGKTGPARYALLLKNQSFSAESPLSLAKGDRLTARVEQLKPQIILQIVRREEPSSLVAGGFLRQYRTNPEALRDLFNLAGGVLGGRSTDGLPESVKGSIQGVLRVINSLVYSPACLANPLFLIELAERHNIPVKADPVLVQLLSRLDIDEEIPAELYKAVAEILAFVYAVNERRRESPDGPAIPP